MREYMLRFRHVVGIPSALALSAFVLANTATGVLLEVIPTLTGKLVLVAVLFLTTVLLFSKWDKAWRQGSTAASQIGVPANSQLASRKGLVIVLGLDSAEPDSPVAKMLQRASSVQWIAFLGTPETAEKKVVENIRTKLMPPAGCDLPATHVRTWEFGNAESLADFEQAASEALEWMLRQNLEAEDIVLDITSGRRPMGYGAMTAANRYLVETQYHANAWDHLQNRPVPGKETFKVVQDFAR